MTVRKRAQLRRAQLDEQWFRDYLTTGCSFPFARTDRPNESPTEEEASEAWELWGDEIKREFAENYRHGDAHSMRSFGEWVFELIPKYGERRTTAYWSAEHEAHRGKWTKLGVLHTNTWPPLQETEEEYLTRNGLPADPAEALS